MFATISASGGPALPFGDSGIVLLLLCVGLVIALKSYRSWRQRRAHVPPPTRSKTAETAAAAAATQPAQDHPPVARSDDSGQLEEVLRKLPQSERERLKVFIRRRN
jgi:uncharacterized iron-regulated membrane protein